jgi:aryl-alcohol dehydrogenase-like predicted oxidoreductase
VIAIPGARRPEHAAASARAADLALGPEELEAIDAAHFSKD